MSVLEKTAYLQGHRDEVPNQELAKELAEANDVEGIREIVENLSNKDKNIQNDCIKVLYEVGYRRPNLIEQYADNFIALLSGRNNRLVWGSMIALSTIAETQADAIYQNLEIIQTSMKEGSVIVVDNAVKVLATMASVKEEYEEKIFPMLLEHLGTCRPKEVCQHAESTLLAVNARNQEEFISMLRTREQSMTSAQVARIHKLYKKLHV